jgi:hypothetical protein
VTTPDPTPCCVRVDLVSQWREGDKAIYKAHPGDAGEECQVVGVAGETVLVEADPFPFGNPQRWSADVSELHSLPAPEPSCEEVVPDGPEDASLCGQGVVPGSDRCADHGGATDRAPAAGDVLARLLWGLALTDERFVEEIGSGPSETRDALHEVMRQANAMVAAPQATAEPAEEATHDVEITIHDDGWATAECRTCGASIGESAEDTVADWADQHRADRRSGPAAREAAAHPDTTKEA